MQESLMIIVRELPHLRDPAALHGWVRQISVRESVRIARRSNRSEPRDPSEPALSGRSSVDHYAALDDSIDITSTLGAMDPAHRAVVVLRDLEGLSEAEVARVLSIPIGTVKSRAHRGRAAFRASWGPER